MRLILLRHGQSEWNLSNRFTGWTDVDLSEAGREEARMAGLKIRDAGIKPRYCFTSYLRRAIHTGQIALAAMERDYIPMVKDWHLNERHYGALQGLNKAETAEKYGDEQVHIWRRSYDVQPPAMLPGNPEAPRNQEMYADLSDDQLPLTESLADTVVRVRPCWEELIMPALRLYTTVLVAAHGNSLRALLMILRHISPEDIVGLEIATGAPIVLTLDSRMNVVSEEHL